MTTTTTTTPDVTHMQASFTDLPNISVFAFKRAARGVPYQDRDLLLAASVALQMQGLGVYQQYGAPAYLEIAFDSESNRDLSRELIIELAQAAAREFRLYCAVLGNRVMLVGPVTAGAGGLCLTDYLARVARRAEKRCEHD